MALDLKADITRLKGAEYNPRNIVGEDLEALRESVRTLGVVKPIIAHGETIVAGHQRTKALTAEGVTTAPVYFIEQDLTVYDEVLFNQLHNGTDSDEGNPDAVLDGELSVGWNQIPADSVRGNFRSEGAALRAQMSRLILKYGPWGGVVALDTGEVIHCGHYAIACASTGEDVLAYVVPAAKRKEYMERLGRVYGVYSYDHVERKDYLQSLAQLPRLRVKTAGAKKSALYEKMVRPWLKENPTAKVLDFGCGHGDYVKMLSKLGFDIRGFDPFHRKGKALNLSKINRMVDGIKEAGCQFDAVVCDSVINSVNCVESRDALFTTIAAFCKPGGTVFTAGRSKKYKEGTRRFTASKMRTQTVNLLTFFDENGFSGTYRKGAWFFQLYNDRPEIEVLADYAGMDIEEGSFCDTRGDWQASLKVREQRPSEDQVLKAIEWEFNLPISGDARLGRMDMVDAVRDALFSN
ncbi:MAG: methyltransferase domain-containing protein [Myxococcales bacterium]|nr:methyltransferase domain-containing protein [Myxococcales bacterium]